MLSLCQQLNNVCVCPPTPELATDTESDLLSWSPSPLAQYKGPPIVGSRAPTPTYEPDTLPPLFLPVSDDKTDNVRMILLCDLFTLTPLFQDAPLSHNTADTPPVHPRPRPLSLPRKRRRVHVR
jgi:hypothetical protein